MRFGSITAAPAMVGNQSLPSRALNPAGCVPPLHSAFFMPSATPNERERLSRGVVLLDPPRAGAGREVVEHITALSPATVVYVACDPVALARDIATFRAAGYEPARIQGLDLFPHSHHVEAVATLTRARARG